MRILHVIMAFNTGGAETMLIDIANIQVKMGNEVGILIVNDSVTPNLLSCLDNNVKVFYNKRIPGSRNPLSLLKLNVTIYHFGPDVVHVHNSSIPKMIFNIVSHSLFFTVHALNIVPKCVKRLRMIAISDAVYNDIHDRYPNVQIRTIPNGINDDSIRLRKPMKLKGKLKIIQVARLDSKKKGQDLLIKSIAQLKEAGHHNYDVTFIGGGEEEQYLKSLAKRLNVEGQVHFLGLRNREYIYNHLADYDLMCHPARYEGFGLTIAEGACAGLPLLVSDEGGPYEIIEKGGLGYSFKMGDYNDLSVKLITIYNQYDKALMLAEKARIIVHKKYSIQRMVESYLEYYQCG